MARILIVDDNPDLCFVMNKLIERMGHESITASNGLEALHFLERNVFDIVDLPPDLVPHSELEYRY